MTTTQKEKESIVVRRTEPARWPEEMETIFDRAFKQFGLRPLQRTWLLWPRTWRAEAWIPDMDILEKDGSVTVRLDLPGVMKNNIEVTVEGDMLAIRGRRHEEKETKEAAYHCVERASGDFYRAISLPEGARIESIEAAYRDGVLEVTIPCVTPKVAVKRTVEVK